MQMQWFFRINKGTFQMFVICKIPQNECLYFGCVRRYCILKSTFLLRWISINDDKETWIFSLLEAVNGRPSIYLHSLVLSYLLSENLAGSKLG